MPSSRPSEHLLSLCGSATNYVALTMQHWPSTDIRLHFISLGEFPSTHACGKYVWTASFGMGVLQFSCQSNENAARSWIGFWRILSFFSPVGPFLPHLCV